MSENDAGSKESRPGACLVYMTAPDENVAGCLARTLVEERLAACVNLLGPIRSIYRWEGRIEQSEEFALVAKTASSQVARLTQRVLSLHPYACPCVVALPIEGGNAAFLHWIRSESAPAAGG